MSKIQLTQIDTRAPADLDKKEVKEKTQSILSELDEFKIFYLQKTNTPF